MSNKTLETLAKIQAVITESHIVYTSGKHGSAYVNKDAIYPHTEITSQLCLEIAQHFAKSQIEVVVAPAIGGVILSQWVAYHLTKLTGKEIFGVYAEKIEDRFVIKRGYDKICRSKRILVVEDIVNTGGSVLGVINAVRAIPAEIIGVAALCNRGGLTASELGNVPEFFALATVQLEAWNPEQCPLCAQGVPINTEVGKGKSRLSS